MAHIIVGLGNPGVEYEDTRHNAGRMAVTLLGKKYDALWKTDSKAKTERGSIKIGTKLATLLLPNTFMNTSGSAVKYFVKTMKEAEKMTVVYDDLDLPLGVIKISYDRSSGGHKGLESIIKAVKTTKFARVRIGISPHTPKGKTKKPASEKVNNFVIGAFSPKETLELKKSLKTAVQALECIVTENHLIAMQDFN